MERKLKSISKKKLKEIVKLILTIFNIFIENISYDIIISSTILYTYNFSKLSDFIENDFLSVFCIILAF